MLSYLLRGILIGLLFGVPVGAVGALTIQRTWSFGLRAGLLTGLGSSVADCAYAIVGAFGLTLISNFLLMHQAIIHAIGGSLLLFVGITQIFKKSKATVLAPTKLGAVKTILSSFAIGITNPAAVIAFMFAFSYFGISAQAKAQERAALVCGVFIGTYLWWLTISCIAAYIKKRAKTNGFRHGNKLFGGIIALFGAIILITRSF